MDTAAQPHRIVGIAASAGGLTAIIAILAALPRGFPYPLLVVLHLAPTSPSHLAEILSWRTELSVHEAVDGECLRPGTVYVAPPNWHLTVTGALRVHLTQAPATHFVRPSADVLFTSIAAACGPAGVGILCSGTGEDGAEGLRLLRDRGGLTLVQDQASCDYFGMPGAAIRLGAASEVLPLSEIGLRLVALAAGTPNVSPARKPPPLR